MKAFTPQVLASVLRLLEVKTIYKKINKAQSHSVKKERERKRETERETESVLPNLESSKIGISSKQELFQIFTFSQASECELYIYLR